MATPRWDLYTKGGSVSWCTFGNDNPKALEPREIEKSRRKGPFAVRTVFGWTMNDPLGRERTGGNHTDNLMKWDFELEEQFKRFCKSLVTLLWTQTCKCLKMITKRLQLWSKQRF